MSDKSHGDFPLTLLDLLSTSLVLHQIAPYLPVTSRLALAATSKSYRNVLYNAPETFRHVELSSLRRFILPEPAVDRGGTSWRSQRMDEALTPDEFYSGPLRGLFNQLARKKLLQNVQTLILDGLSVTAELVSEMLLDERFNVRILSIRQVRHMNEKILQQALTYACRPSRPEGSPTIKGIYYFGAKDLPLPKNLPSSHGASEQIINDQGILSSEGAQIGATWNSRSQTALNSSLGHCADRWYQASGRMFKRPPKREWASTLKSCEGIIAFDAVLCRGPRHDVMYLGQSDIPMIEPQIADIALGPSGCAKCGTMPEGPAVFDLSPSHHLPLLDPPPLHSSTVRGAQLPTFSNYPNRKYPPLLARCSACLREQRRERWCERCGIWWDEFCYPDTAAGKHLQEIGVKHDCYGCGATCSQCKSKYMRTCRYCRSEYCIVDNEGSTNSVCDWCNHSGRRTRELY